MQRLCLELASTRDQVRCSSNAVQTIQLSQGLPALTATCKIHVFLMPFFIEERQQNAVTFFLERHRRPLFAFLVCTMVCTS